MASARPIQAAFTSARRAVQPQRTSPLVASCRDQYLPYRNLSSSRITGRQAKTSPLNSAKSACSRTNYSTYSSAPPGEGGNFRLRYKHLFGLLILLGLSSTTYGLYQFYTSLKSYPPAVRTPLRQGLRCHQRKDDRSAVGYLRKALEEAHNITESEREKERWKGEWDWKVSGIVAKLGEVLEKMGDLEEAVKVYEEGFRDLGGRIQGGQPLEEEPKDPRVLLRLISLAQRIGHLSSTISSLPPTQVSGSTFSERKKRLKSYIEKAESYLSWSVEEILRSTSARQMVDSKRGDGGDDAAVLADELDLPDWISKSDFGASLESLADFFASQGNVEYAMPLYLQSINILLPPQPNGSQSTSYLPTLLSSSKSTPPRESKCHAATIMNNLSSLLASASYPVSSDPSSFSSDPTSKNDQAIAWARKAVDIAESNAGGSKVKDAGDNECELVKVVGLYNLGVLNGELAGRNPDFQQSRSFLTNSRRKAQEIGMREGVRRASDALNRLDKLEAVHNRSTGGR